MGYCTSEGPLRYNPLCMNLALQLDPQQASSHANKWVAVHSGRVLFSDHDADAVLRYAHLQGPQVELIFFVVGI